MEKLDILDTFPFAVTKVLWQKLLKRKMGVLISWFQVLVDCGKEVIAMGVGDTKFWSEMSNECMGAY